MSQFRLKGTSGSVINRSFPVVKAVVIGAAEDCDIRVDEPGVAARQAEVRLNGDGSLLLTDLADNRATVLNGESVRKQELNTGDEIRIGTCRWLLQAPGLRPRRVLSPAAARTSGMDWVRVFAWTLVVALAGAVAVLRFWPEWFVR